MEADLKDRKRKQFDKAKTAEKCRQRGNQCMTEGGPVLGIDVPPISYMFVDDFMRKNEIS